jgi:ATP-dependent helicase HrpB
VLTAPPGTGKTTLVPLALVREDWLDGRIVLLEPRRLATRAAARRMAHLLGEDVGGTVGYQTRDERVASAGTRIEVITEGILTRRLQTDPELPGTAVVVFDEVHERNLQTDLGLALALDAAEHVRPDLGILVMSATLDAGAVARLLSTDGPAPVFAAGGAPHHVDLRWLPRRERDRLEPAVAVAVQRALGEEAGDVLVFLPGSGEIQRVGDLLRDALGDDVVVRPLYGMLGADQQDSALVVDPEGRRRVVLATDIAESSLTVEGVRIVVDSGLARAPRFDPRTGMTRLQTIAVSKASADQRAGRAGRLGPGTCYRLWSKGEHATRRPHRAPEIADVDLAGYALELCAWGTPDPASLRFLDPPPARTYADALALLEQLGAVGGDRRVTATGTAMAALPVHPRLAHMIVLAGTPDARATACALAVLLEERDLFRGRPDDVPTDVALRLTAVTGAWLAGDVEVDRRTLSTVRRRTDDLRRRVGARDGAVDPSLAGDLLALAYPDRLAVRRGQPGRFQLRSGAAAWVQPTDPLAEETFVVAADLDGNRKQARIRLAAGLDPATVATRWAAVVETRTQIAWDDAREVAMERTTTLLGGMVLAERGGAAPAGSEARSLVLAAIARRGLDALPWDAGTRSLLARLRFLRAHLGDPWPSLDDEVLLGTLDDWLAPFVPAATGLGDVTAHDLTRAVAALVPPGERHRLDVLAPDHVVLPNGRRHRLDYGRGEQPVLAVRVQELFGSPTGPAVLDGRVPVLLELLSPAGRPVQVTSDLAGFWTGSWQQVRKEMAGRYPKHAWPADPRRDRA